MALLFFHLHFFVMKLIEDAAPSLCFVSIHLFYLWKQMNDTGGNILKEDIYKWKEQLKPFSFDCVMYMMHLDRLSFITRFSNKEHALNSSHFYISGT